jgi:C-terminal processing protease CtpA/Prc
VTLSPNYEYLDNDNSNSALSPVKRVFHETIQSGVEGQQPAVEYVRIDSFGIKSSQYLIDTLKELKMLKEISSGSNRIQSFTDMNPSSYPLLILDLRNNYGGLIQEAMLSASLFLEDVNSVICYISSNRANTISRTVNDFIIDQSP